ncbi:MAG: ABC transporter ATP-binding protein [Flavobacteriales bacterium]|jgi:iron complex transport system ATP-binding protein|nr:ABC transporter ATP-binding protein [Flavobacteriales bacterium]
MSPALLHTVDLDVGHGARALVRHIALELRPGALTALIGVNGSGKSTLLRTLAGLLPPLRGHVHAGGHDLRTLSAPERARRIALVTPAPAATGLLDVRTLVAFGRHPWTGRLGRLAPADHRAVEAAMDMAGIAHLARRPVDRLSDGERQQVVIARALAQATPVMLLDEPTAFLDLVNRVRIMRLLRTIATGQGKAMLLSTHDLRTALDHAHRLLVIDRGHAWAGTPGEALRNGHLARAFERDGLVLDPVTGALR